MNLDDEQFLKPTRLCDFDHPAVKAVMESIACEPNSRKQTAVAIFNFVRDSVLHEWVPTDQSASTTLETRRGDCWPKSILQIAMLRASGIPARFRWFEYRKSAFQYLVPPSVYLHLADPFPFHSVAEVYIEGEWILADSTFDRQLSPTRAMDWDGASHLLVFSPTEITRDLGYTASFEEKVPEIGDFFAAIPTSDTVAMPEEVQTDIVNMNFELIRLRNMVDSLRSP